MARSDIHKGWWRNQTDNRLDIYYNTTRVGHISSTGLTLTGGGITSGDFDINDDLSLRLGTGNDVEILYSTADANANELVIDLPAGGGTNVPAIVIGPGMKAFDVALYDGRVSPVVGIFGTTATATGPIIEFRKSRGTNVAPTVVTSGDDMGSVDFYGAVAAGEYVRGARILAEMTGTVATTRGPGVMTFQTATDAAPSVLTTALTISAAQAVDLPLGVLTVGTSGTTTGIISIDGATSGTVNITAVAAAGAWTLTLPAAVGSAGQQLTDAGGNGIATWAAASLGEWKNDLGILDPEEALAAVVKAPTHVFTYKPEVMPAGQWAPPDRMTGIFAEEAPWAMHGKRDGIRNGIAFSTINAFGYARAAIQALAEKVERLEAKVA